MLHPRVADDDKGNGCLKEKKKRIFLNMKASKKKVNCEYEGR
jgi:hypothetical protein